MNTIKIDPNNLSARRCQTDDLLFVHDLLKKNMAETMFRNRGEEWNSDLFWEKTKPGSIIIVEYQDRPIAFFDAFKEGDFLHLLNINVAEEFQNQGIGRYMLALVEGKAREMELMKIILEVFPDNPSRYLYTRYGFNKVGMRDGCWVMEKTIDY